MRKVKKSAFLLLVLLGCTVFSGCQAKSDATEDSGEKGSAMGEKAVKVKSEDVTFESKRGTKIYSTVVTPAEMTDESYPVVLFSHGFVGSRDGDGAFPKIAEKLAEENILSIMIDFAGNNESEEPYTNYTIKNMSEDMDTALDYMKENYKIDQDKIGLMGHSMGARMTALKLNDQIKAAAIWAPAAAPGLEGIYDFMGGKESVEKYYQEAQENDLAVFDFYGEENAIDLSLDFFEGVKESNPVETINNYQGNLFIAVAEKDPAIRKETTDQAIKAATNVEELSVCTIKNADHGFKNIENGEDTSVQGYTIDRTADFLIQKLK
ncbi:hypothetical protein NRIC_33370 [Enterococcus florum]|uniref:AB hydrolase-1 domain-containing protein n=1 Tax=Enterococcus florum TaxID=2480627 RepID=A0A4P5PCB8_9ENTE|nr:alpha/beta fold hydrolase [Enterococcus florum]GCF95446.1 hypothetical protein NRIC_33370 [Enterococcus florum]